MASVISPFVQYLKLTIISSFFVDIERNFSILFAAPAPLNPQCSLTGSPSGQFHAYLCQPYLRALTWRVQHMIFILLVAPDTDVGNGRTMRLHRARTWAVLSNPRARGRLDMPRSSLRVHSSVRAPTSYAACLKCLSGEGCCTVESPFGSVGTAIYLYHTSASSLASDEHAKEEAPV